MPPPEVAFSYSRFSSAAQSDGDSVRRQSALRAGWLKRHPGVVEDTSLDLTDRGVSGFRGAHRTDPKHAMSRFLELVERGRVPRGAWLLVESVDRITRESPEEAVPFVLSLVKAGIRIAVLSPFETVFEAGMDQGRMILLLLEVFRGHGESARKRDLCGEAWAELKRLAREEGRPLGKNLHPAWVRIEDGKHVLVPDAAAAVRKVFRLSARGVGTAEITRKLNKTGVPAIGKKGVWVRSYVQKLLSDRTVLGEYRPSFGRRRNQPDGDVIEAYWPAAISPAEWQAARAGMSARSTRPTRRRPARVAHPFQGLLTDALDGCGMYTVTLGGRKYVVSQKGYDDPRGDTHRRPFPLDALQDALLFCMRELAAADLFGDPSGGEVAAAEAKLSVVERRLSAAVERFEADPENRTWGDKVDEYDRQRRVAVAELAAARAKAADPLPAAWGEAVALMAKDEPARLRACLARVVDEVRVLVVKRGQTRVCACQVYFAGGSVRHYLVAWTRTVVLPRFRRPESCAVESFEAAGLPALDLRQPADAARLEKAIGRWSPRT